MISTRELNELPLEERPKAEERQNTVPFPPPIVDANSGSVTFQNQPAEPDVEVSRLDMGESPEGAEAFGQPESLEIPEPLDVPLSDAARGTTLDFESSDATVAEASSASLNQDFIDFSDLLAELDAAHERNDQASLPTARDPAAALRGQRWIEPKRMSARTSNPDSLKPMARKLKPGARTQSNVAVGLAGAAVVLGVLVGIRIAMSRAEMSPLVTRSSKPTPRSALAKESSTTTDVPSREIESPMSEAAITPIAEPPSSASAAPAPVTAAMPPAKRPHRLNSPKNTASSASRPLSSESADANVGVPISEVYVNKNGDLVDAQGQPLHRNVARPEPSNVDNSEAAPRYPSTQTATPTHEGNGPDSSTPKDPTPVDEAQPWQ